MTLLQRFLAFLGLAKLAPEWTASRAEDMPEELEPQTVYLVGETSCPWAAAFVCPCGCEAMISLSLVRGDDPSWVASVDGKGRPTIHPSVWRVRGCKSHFILRQGRIIWAQSIRP